MTRRAWGDVALMLWLGVMLAGIVGAYLGALG